MRIPFCPLPLNRARVIAKIFYGLAEPLMKIFPSLGIELKQAGFPVDGREYLSIAILSSLFISLILFFPFAIISTTFVSFAKGLSISLAISLVLFFITLFYIRTYPKLIIKRRVADIERNLIYALKHIYVHVKAGVPIFDAMVFVSSGNYGAVSRELKGVVKEVRSGTQMGFALEELALKNPSLYFRRAIWQISNGLKAGSDIGDLLKDIIENISSEQKIAIRRYGSQLNPLTLVYMMIAIIIPSLGITFLMVLSTFSGISISETMFWIIMISLAFFQYMFMGIIKSRRPNIV